MNNNPLISYDRIGNSTITLFHNCITALPQYEKQSIEELRWEDYQLKRKYPNVPPQIPAQAAATTSSTTLISSSNRVNSTNGTRQFKYKKTPGADLKQSLDGKSLICMDTNHMCITAMHEYEKCSFEELRFQDYKNKCKYPLQQSNSAVTNLSSSFVFNSNNTAKFTFNSSAINNVANSTNNSKTSMPNVAKTDKTLNLETEDVSGCPICLESILKVQFKFIISNVFRNRITLKTLNSAIIRAKFFPFYVQIKYFYRS